eukprot:362934-Chlamydomonas_euryale.AAC.1
MQRSTCMRPLVHERMCTCIRVHGRIVARTPTYTPAWVHTSADAAMHAHISAWQRGRHHAEAFHRGQQPSLTSLNTQGCPRFTVRTWSLPRTRCTGLAGAPPGAADSSPMQCAPATARRPRPWPAGTHTAPAMQPAACWLRARRRIRLVKGETRKAAVASGSGFPPATCGRASVGGGRWRRLRRLLLKARPQHRQLAHASCCWCGCDVWRDFSYARQGPSLGGNDVVVQSTEQGAIC